jgi:hypothetical protein
MPLTREEVSIKRKIVRDLASVRVAFDHADYLIQGRENLDEVLVQIGN